MAPTSMNPSLIFRRYSEAAYQSALECARPLANDVGEGLGGPGTLTLRYLMVAISGPCLGVTILGCWFLCWRHLHRYTSPQEQRQIIRVINLPVFYCLFNFLALTFTLDYMYIQPIANIYEAFAVSAMFFLILEYACPDGTDREKYFQNLELRSRQGKPLPGGSLKWFQRTWSAALQYPAMRLVLVVIQIITQYYGDFCEASWSPKHAHLWLQLADWFFVGGALGATLRFGGRLRSEIAPVRRVRQKMWSFVGIILFQIIQDLIFHTFNGKLFNPTKKVTYNDINFGISSFMTCVECLIFTGIFYWSFSSSEYKEGMRRDRLNMGPAPRTRTFRAVFDALNLSDIIAGTVLAFQMLFTRVRGNLYGGRSGGGAGSGAGVVNSKDHNINMNSINLSSNHNNAPSQQHQYQQQHQFQQQRQYEQEQQYYHSRLGSDDTNTDLQPLRPSPSHSPQPQQQYQAPFYADNAPYDPTSHSQPPAAPFAGAPPPPPQQGMPAQYYQSRP